MNLNDPFTKTQGIARNIDRISNPRMNAYLRHSEASTNFKMPYISEVSKPDPLKQMTQSVSSKVRHIKKTVRLNGKDVVKVKAHTSPLKVEAKAVVDRFKGMSSFAKTAVDKGSELASTMMSESFSKGIYSIKAASNYMSDKYSKGYDTIKESLTDFGSRVHLNKATSRVNVTPRNTTRDATLKTTTSITNANLAFKLHKDAIGHTRY